jgi:hypothetical protein
MNPLRSKLLAVAAALVAAASALPLAAANADEAAPQGAGLPAVSTRKSAAFVAPPSGIEPDAYYWDDTVLSFSTVGDSRQDPVTFDPTTAPLSGQDQIWLQNTKAWTRIMRSIERQQPDLLFFDGDMIMGYGWAAKPTLNSNPDDVSDVIKSDLVQFYTQYAFWRGMVANLMETGTYVVPVPGNHETQCKSCTVKGVAQKKKSQVENENAWRANMGDLILDKARFAAILGGPAANVDTDRTALDAADGLTTDQSKLTYSFDFLGSHFAVINTDPVGSDAHAPTKWLASDFAAAASRGIKHFFVFGHKPAFTYYYGNQSALPASPSGLDVDTAARDAFWNVVAQYGAVYFCGHEHIFHVSQHLAPNGKSAWQVLVGSGGSPFEALPTDPTLDPFLDRAYAWATVRVTVRGTVEVTAYGFDDHFGPTRVLRSIVLN